ncbi:MAG: UDP-3-O-(3-hydroxymyristoyl)glucosamine N-acyltransferase [Holosporales bacterium]|jgi:UDP-3-O-[3-hydroxymyristoyl] glucosamine N-acyltransferase|nr:UDP-3-O-(3-hydroxymyristoyl)glucosamine N-acyltransferase [Holosporales bacterium]
MIDTNFYERRAPITLARICELLAIDIPERCDPGFVIQDIGRLDQATDSDITFFHNAKYIDELSKTKAFACLISSKYSSLLPEHTHAIVVEDPYLALAILLREFYAIKTDHDRSRPYISEKASVSGSAVIGDGCYISDFVSIGKDVIIKNGSFIGPNCSILRGVEIGKNAHIEPNVTISFAKIGDNAYIKAGARIGQQGFGFQIGRNGLVDVLQIGRVLIGNNVQIGANCTIDRGSMDDTIIGNNVRIDDMVHIAHNVAIGDYCVIAAQTGIAGSTTLGKGCMLGGQVGIVGHVIIGDRVSIAAQSGVMQNVENGKRIAGSPAMNAFSWQRLNVIFRKLDGGTSITG